MDEARHNAPFPKMSLHGERSSSLDKGHPWDTRSLISGGSGIFYALPLLFGFPSLSYFEATYLVVQAIVSVMSDYVYVLCPSTWHLCDRYLSKLGVAYYAYVALSAGLGVFVSIWPPVVALFILGSYLRRNRNHVGYKYAHLAWHVGGGAAIAYVHHYYLAPMVE